MAWINLFLAAIFEVGWPLGFKLASISSYKVLWIVFAVISMTLSGIFLYLAQKEIPIGTAYAVWTGIGASCTFLLGAIVFHDTVNLMKIFGVILIVSGVILLKLAH